MRDHEFFRVDDRISEEQDIDIDDARTFFLETPAAHLPLQIKDSGQQLPWHLLGAEFNGAIQEPRLSGESYRLGLVERRYGLDAAQCSETCNGDIQVGGTIIKVRAEREVDVFVHGNSFPILAFAFQNKMLNLSSASLVSEPSRKWSITSVTFGGPGSRLTSMHHAVGVASREP